MQSHRIINHLFAIALLMRFLCPVHSSILYLNHFDQSLDADHSLYGDPKANPEGMDLSKEGLGVPFQGVKSQRALDAGYSSSDKKKAVVRYSVLNLDSRRGTIEMWVKCSWDADLLNTRKTDLFHHFFSAPLENKGSINLYYACYRWNYFTPCLVFHINNGKPLRQGELDPDYIINFRVANNEKEDGFVWQKDTWHYLVATWTPTLMRLFADGKLMAERTFEKPFDIPPVAGPICLGNNVGNWGGTDCLADALIDEVRICDAPLYASEKTISVPTTPLAKEIKGAVLSAGGFEAFTQPDPRQYYCYKVETPPTIDGKIDDEIWKNIPAWSGFLVYGKYDQYIDQQTEIKICRDDRNIYIAALVREDHLDSIKTAAKPGSEDTRVFGDDVLELYLAPKQNETPNVQIGINSINAYCDILHTEGKADFKWNGTWQSATGKTAEGWVVEFSFPYSDITSHLTKGGTNTELKIGDIWGFRAGRNHVSSGGRLSAINYATTGFQNPLEFARLIMAGELPKLDVIAEENKLNKGYLDFLRKRAGVFINETQRQLNFVADIPKTTKDKQGITTLERDVRTVTAECQRLASVKQSVPIEQWNRLFMALKTSAEKCDRLAYLAASVGGIQAVIPPDALSGIKKVGGIWYLASKQLAAAIDPKHGMVAGLWDRKTGQRLMVSSYLLYELQTKKSEKKLDERTDRVTRSSVQGDKLVLECSNPDLSGIQLRKLYYLSKVDKDPRSLCRRLEISGKVKEMSLLQTTSRTLFDDDYRKPSFYNRLFMIGTMGDGRSCVPAVEITSPMIQRGWFNSTEGRAQFALINPQLGSGLGEYFYKENDAWTYPQALSQSYWTPFGWDMGFAATFVKEKPYSAELRYHLFRGDRLTFHREYLALPEYAAIRKDWMPSPLSRRSIPLGGPIVQQALGEAPVTLKYIQATAGSMKDVLRSDEIGLSAWAPWDTHWPDLPDDDGQDIVQTHNNKSGVILGKYPVKEVKAALRRIKGVNSNILSGTYTFVVDLEKSSQAFKEHPEWVVITREGTPLEGCYGTEYVRANFCPAFVKHLTERLLSNCDSFGYDFCYLDYGVGILTPDWGRGEMITFKVYLGFLKELQRELSRRSKLLWLNSAVGQPYYDLGYFEGCGACSQWGKTWRDNADIEFMNKLYLPAGVPCILLYWLGGDMFKEQGSYNEVRYIDRVLASGLTPAGCYLDPYHLHFPTKEGGADWKAIYQYVIGVHHAAYEMRESESAEVGLKPAWWRDPTTELEIHTLRIPRLTSEREKALPLTHTPTPPLSSYTYLVNVVSHEKETKDAQLSVDLRIMGFDPSKRLFAWQFLRRDYSKYPKSAPPPTNWNEMFSSRVCASFQPGKSEFSYIIPQLPPDRVCITALTQTPASIISASGLPTQTLLPATLNCRITGDLDESSKSVLLHVVSDKTIEVIAWWPKAWGPAKITTQGRSLNGVPVTFGVEDFVRFSLDKGDWRVQVEGLPSGA